MPRSVWEKIAPLLPPAPPHPRGGRPRRDDRTILSGIFYPLRTGCQWKALPRPFGPASTVHARFQEWTRAGVFDRFHAAGLLHYDARHGIAWGWQSADGTMTKAPLGGEATGPNPTDRGKSGTKRSLLSDGRGQPLSVAVAGANVNDHLLLAKTLDSIPVPRPLPTPQDPHHLWWTRVTTIRVSPRSCRNETTPLTCGRVARRPSPSATSLGYRARRWVVERTHSWINRFRRLLVRWEKKVENYLALLKLAFTWHLFRAAGICD
ncbi:MAG: IS5 family transposase [Firmicutes bacterium]|nr:IS5 family transposase [Bacillota bacterium]